MKLLKYSEYIEDIYFFEVNTEYTYISSNVLKISAFSRLRCTSEIDDIFNTRDEILFLFYTFQENNGKQTATITSRPFPLVQRVK